MVRAVEHALGLFVPGLDVPKPSSHLNVTEAFQETISLNIYDAEVRSVLQDSISVLQDMGTTFNVLGALSTISNSTKSLLTTAYVWVLSFRIGVEIYRFTVPWTIIGNMIVRAILRLQLSGLRCMTIVFIFRTSFASQSLFRD